MHPGTGHILCRLKGGYKDRHVVNEFSFNPGLYLLNTCLLGVAFGFARGLTFRLSGEVLRGEITVVVAV